MTLTAIHPKAGGAALGTAAGVLIVAVLHSAGVHMAAELPAAITGFLATFGAWLVPGPSSAAVPASPAASTDTPPRSAEPVTRTDTPAQAADQGPSTSGVFPP